MVSGLNFDVDGFLKTTGLETVGIYHKGDMVIGPDQTRIPRTDSGYMAIIDRDETRPLKYHINQTAKFLIQHESSLKKARSFGADDLRLNFFYPNLEVHELSHYLPPELLLLAGVLGIGIEMSAMRFETKKTR